MKIKNIKYLMLRITHLHDAADILTSISGKKITYISPSKEDYKNALANAGLPKAAIEVSAGFADAIKQGEFEETSNDLENLLGRKPVSLKEFLTSVYKK